MRVELITHTPEPEKVVATAAKLCYSSSDIASLRDGLTEEKTKSFIERLVSIGHESPMGTFLSHLASKGYPVPALISWSDTELRLIHRRASVM